MELLPVHYTFWCRASVLWFFFSPLPSRSPQALTDFLLLKCAPSLHSLQLPFGLFFCQSWQPIFLKICHPFSSLQASHFYWGCCYMAGTGRARNSWSLAGIKARLTWFILLLRGCLCLVVYSLWHGFLSYHRPCHPAMISCQIRSFRVNSLSLSQFLKYSITWLTSLPQPHR